MPKASALSPKVTLPVILTLPENSLPRSPAISGALMVTEPRFTTPAPEASVSASSRRLPPPDVAMPALTLTLLIAASFRLTPDCMDTAALTLMSLLACSSTVPEVKACSEATFSVPLVALSGSPNASSGSPGTDRNPSSVPAPACTVMLNGSRSSLPPLPPNASRPAVPSNTSTFLPETSINPPLPPSVPPCTEAWPK